MSTPPPPARRLPEVNYMEGGGVRYMHFETPWIQGAMRMDAPDEIELDYVQRMMAWMLFRDEAAVTEGHAVQLGLGAGAITRYCLKRLKMRTTAVELNGHVIDACRLWFRLPRDSKLLRGMVRGLMIESYLVEGSQDVSGTVRGKSITDPCLGWEDSEALVRRLAEVA
jgi:hypothetical protein